MHRPFHRDTTLWTIYQDKVKRQRYDIIVCKISMLLWNQFIHKCVGRRVSQWVSQLLVKKLVVQLASTLISFNIRMNQCRPKAKKRRCTVLHRYTTERHMQISGTMKKPVRHTKKTLVYEKSECNVKKIAAQCHKSVWNVKFLVHLYHRADIFTFGAVFHISRWFFVWCADFVYVNHIFSYAALSCTCDTQ